MTDKILIEMSQKKDSQSELKTVIVKKGEPQITGVYAPHTTYKISSEEKALRDYGLPPSEDDYFKYHYVPQRKTPRKSRQETDECYLKRFIDGEQWYVNDAMDDELIIDDVDI